MSLNEIAVNAVWAAPFIGTAIVLFLSLILHKNKFRNLISVGSLFVSAIFSTLSAHTRIAKQQRRYPVHYSLDSLHRCQLSIVY